MPRKGRARGGATGSVSATPTPTTSRRTRSSGKVDQVLEEVKSIPPDIYQTTHPPSSPPLSIISKERRGRSRTSVGDSDGDIGVASGSGGDVATTPAEASLVFSIPSSTGSAITSLTASSGNQTCTAGIPPIYAKKSKPAVPMGIMDRLKWLGYPQWLLNRVKNDEDLAGINWGPGSRLGDGEDKLMIHLEHVESEDDDGWETLSEAESSTSSEGEWEEQLVYVELDDIPSIQELFAVQPDDFLRFQKKKYRQMSQPVKATHPKITIQFHGFASASPVLQIGSRYFSCRWEEPIGSAMFFRKNSDAAGSSRSKLSNKNDPSRRPCATLQNIVPKPTIPWDNVFGREHTIRKDTYEAVALADKVLKTELLEADTKKLDRIPTHRQFFGRPGTYKFKVPHGYTTTDLLAGEYVPKRTYVRRSKEQIITDEDVLSSSKMKKSSRTLNEGSDPLSETMMDVSVSKSTGFSGTDIN